MDQAEEDSGPIPFPRQLLDLLPEALAGQENTLQALPPQGRERGTDRAEQAEKEQDRQRLSGIRQSGETDTVFQLEQRPSR